MSTTKGRIPKSAQTRALLVDTALRLFREEGYHATTMRRIASAAGVSLGNAYYYFDGKDALVQELYDRIQVEHRDRALPRLVEQAPLATNLRTVLHAGLDTMAPYHSFGATMLAVALSPTASVSPFSTASARPWEAATALMEYAVRTSKGTPTGAIRTRLPHLLWLAYLGVTVHWVSDQTPEQRRTRDLVDGLAPVIGKAVGLTRIPLGRSLATDVVTLLDRVLPTSDQNGTP